MQSDRETIRELVAIVALATIAVPAMISLVLSLVGNVATHGNGTKSGSRTEIHPFEMHSTNSSR